MATLKIEKHSKGNKDNSQKKNNKSEIDKESLMGNLQESHKHNYLLKQSDRNLEPQFNPRLSEKSATVHN